MHISSEEHNCIAVKHRSPRPGPESPGLLYRHRKERVSAPKRLQLKDMMGDNRSAGIRKQGDVAGRDDGQLPSCYGFILKSSALELLD